MNTPITPHDHDDQEVSRQQASAADLVRSKLDKLYDGEPDASEEIAEVQASPEKTLSKHQRHMKQLSESGRSLAEIQVAWHQYYEQLSNKEKHEVWQEFYSQHAQAKQGNKHHTNPHDKAGKSATSHESSHRSSDNAQHANESAVTQRPQVPISNNTAAMRHKRGRGRRASGGTTRQIKGHVLSQVEARSRITKNPHVRSLAFGVTMGLFTVFFLLFGFFNERFITPFIRPNTNVSATPIIIDPQANGPVGPEPKIIIPKINVEAPVVYDVPSISEADVQKGLENGVVHYVTTPNPGEKGNSVIFGHSSSNILNKGKYKFAFLMLKSLEKDDTFIIQKDGKRYVYKVYEKFVVSPKDLSVLGPTDKTATVTLITCDPPGTSTNRLIIRAEQIFPSPADNKASAIQPSADTQKPNKLPSNSVSMWQRITGGL